MRTNLVLNEDLLEEAIRISGARSKREAIEAALRLLVEIRSAEQRREAWRSRASRLDSRLAALRLRRPPSELLREDRDRR